VTLAGDRARYGVRFLAGPRPPRVLAPAIPERPRHERRWEGDEVPEVIHGLHISDADVSKVRGISDAFKEDDTVDALGFQRISERFEGWQGTR
jgi:hypothetical protein